MNKFIISVYHMHEETKLYAVEEISKDVLITEIKYQIDQMNYSDYNILRLNDKEIPLPKEYFKNKAYSMPLVQELTEFWENLYDS